MATEYIAYKDHDGVVHHVDKQNEPMSCALASIGMAWQIIRGQCLVNAEEGRLKFRSAFFSGSLLWSQLLGENGGLGGGTADNNVTETLKACGINVTQKDFFFPAGPGYSFSWRKSKIRTGYPAILLVGWYSPTGGGNYKRNGGHFIVAPRVTSKSYVIVLDPGSGTGHELRGNHGHYNNHGRKGFIDEIWYTG